MGALLTKWRRAQWAIVIAPLFPPLVPGLHSGLLRFLFAVVATGLTKITAKAVFQVLVRLAINPNKNHESKESFDRLVRVTSYTTLGVMLLDVSPLACVALGL